MSVKASITIPKPVVPPPAEVTLTLGQDEAVALLALTGSIGGTPGYYREKVIGPLYEELSRVLKPVAAEFKAERKKAGVTVNRYRWSNEYIDAKHADTVEREGALQFYGKGFPRRSS